MIKTILFRSNRHLITCSVILLIVCPVKISAQEYAIGADLSFLKSAEDMGFKFLLDYHYSDTWADPGKQFIPEAWKK